MDRTDEVKTKVFETKEGMKKFLHLVFLDQQYCMLMQSVSQTNGSCQIYLAMNLITVNPFSLTLNIV